MRARSYISTFQECAKSDYSGYDRYDYAVDGVSCLVVAPKKPLPGRPWVWVAEFFGHLAATEFALLDRGFHLAYMAVGNTFGCPNALRHWDAFYADLTGQRGLAKRPGLMAISRGGLYAYRWAAEHPDKVACIYADNPVCDFKSWPGGKGTGPGSPGDWAKLQADYGFASEQQALAYPGNPIDVLRPLADARIPLLHVCGDADSVVPFKENTLVLQRRYEAMGGDIRVIVKPGGDHHPHGLDDPAPIVDFFVRHTRA